MKRNNEAGTWLLCFRKKMFGSIRKICRLKFTNCKQRKYICLVFNKLVIIDEGYFGRVLKNSGAKMGRVRYQKTWSPEVKILRPGLLVPCLPNFCSWVLQNSSKVSLVNYQNLSVLILTTAILANSKTKKLRKLYLDFIRNQLYDQHLQIHYSLIYIFLI